MEVKWTIVTSRAKELYAQGKKLYLLHDDGSEALVEDVSEIDAAIENGIDIGIEIEEPNFDDIAF